MDGWHTEYPDTLVFKDNYIRQTRRPWVCTSCKRRRPAGGPRHEFFGKVDGATVRDSTCPQRQQGAECPWVVRSWPLWRIHYDADPAYPPSYKDRPVSYSETQRAPEQRDAEAYGRDCASHGYRFVRAVRIGDGIPDTDPQEA